MCEENGRSLLCGTEAEGIVGVVDVVECSFWDGHTDYRTKMTEEEENEKLENFANWIEEGDRIGVFVCRILFYHSYYTL